MNEIEYNIKHKPLFASLTLHDGRIIKIYGYMPALELKKLLDEYTRKVREDPMVEIKDVYN